MDPVAVSPDLLRSVTPTRPGGDLDAARAAEAAADFEASFVAAMLKPMFEGLSAEAPFGGGAGEETWRSFLVDAMAERLVSSGGIGLADNLTRELLTLQGLDPEPRPAPTEGGL